MALLDSIRGVIARRVLLNYSIAPDVLQRALPSPFRPKLYKGRGIGGVCMIRFRNLRPRFIPAWLGLSSENAAHRIAVEWEQDGQLKEGVFVPRRDTNSRLNELLGGRVFPGIFSRSRFETRETDSAVTLRIVRRDGGEEIAFAGKLAQQLPSTSIFESLDAASNFFALGATGYSATHTPGHFHGMELKSLTWRVEPMDVEYARSCYLADTQRFPAGSVALDSALLMRDIAHEWHSKPDLCPSSAAQS